MESLFTQFERKRKSAQADPFLKERDPEKLKMFEEAYHAIEFATKDEYLMFLRYVVMQKYTMGENVVVVQTTHHNMHYIQVQDMYEKHTCLKLRIPMDKEKDERLPIEQRFAQTEFDFDGSYISLASGEFLRNGFLQAKDEALNEVCSRRTADYFSGRLKPWFVYFRKEPENQ